MFSDCSDVAPQYRIYFQPLVETLFLQNPRATHFKYHMRYSRATVLAVVLVFFGIMLLSHTPISVMAREKVEAERVANMSSFESNNDNTVQIDGIQFETVMPERVLRIPSKLPGAKTQVQFAIRITNNTETPQRFLLFFARPEFLQANKQKLPRFGPNVNGSYNPQLSDFQLVMPGESVSLLLKGYFHWQHHKLEFVFIEKDGSYWIFSDFNHGRYWIQFTYENQYPAWEQRGGWSDPIDLKPVWEEQIYNNPRSDISKMEDIWVGEVYTYPIEFDLIMY
jgi:hypothetical protein